MASQPSSLPPTATTAAQQADAAPASPVASTGTTYQQFYKPRARAGSNATRTSRTNSVTSLHSSTRPTTLQPPAPSSPLAHSFTPSASHPSATHTGSILPPANFFRPSKPTQPPATPTQARSTRPASLASATSSAAPLIKKPVLADPLHLTPLTHQLSHGSEGSITAGSTTEDHPKAKLNPVARPVPPTRTRRSGDITNTAVGVRQSLERIFRRSTSGETVPKVSAPVGMDPSVNSPPARPTLMPSSAHVPADLAYQNQLPPDQLPSIRPIRKPLRNYQLHPSRNTFFCNGHLLTGGDKPPIAFIVSLSIVLITAGVWFGTTCVWWWNNQSPAVAAVGIYLCLLTIGSMLTTAFRDPGIIPRNLDPDPPYSPASDEEITPVPLPRDLRFRNAVVRVKYCTTCKTYRPPRSSHCKMCDNCVDGCDHHCQWVNNCVGRRNYAVFITFLLAANITLFLVIVTSVLHIYLVAVYEPIPFDVALRVTAGSAVAFSISIIVVWPVLALLFYHLRLLLLNITTIEQIRNQAHAKLIPGPPPPNPFTYQRWYRNVAYLLCRPAGYSWIDAASYAQEDRRLANPGHHGQITRRDGPYAPGPPTNKNDPEKHGIDQEPASA